MNWLMVIRIELKDESEQNKTVGIVQSSAKIGNNFITSKYYEINK